MSDDDAPASGELCEEDLDPVIGGLNVSGEVPVTPTGLADVSGASEVQFQPHFGPYAG